MQIESRDKIEILKPIFENVNYWLTHIEAKNGALIAFNIATIGAIIGSNIYTKARLLSTVTVILLIFSIIVAFYSFIPIIKWVEKDDYTVNENDNLIFYADIAKYDTITYTEKFYENYCQVSNCSLSSVPKLITDYISEIVENSKIVMRKNRLFKLGIKINFLAALFCILSVIVA